MKHVKTEAEKTIELVISMCTDYLVGKGPTEAALVSNLRLMAGRLERLFTARHGNDCYR